MKNYRVDVKILSVNQYEIYIFASIHLFDSSLPLFPFKDEPSLYERLHERRANRLLNGIRLPT